MKAQFSIALTLAASQVHAFWGVSHIIVATQAQTLLEAENQAVLNAALAELAPLKKYYPDITTDEGSHPFSECATFADNIKGEGYSWQSGWHFIDQPYLMQGGTLADFNFEMDTEDIKDCLSNLYEWLAGIGSEYENSTYYQQINAAFPYPEDARSFALRLIIHYVGDLHQPLHATSLVDYDYPEGDAGGNREYLPNICGAYNLHAAWDSLAYNYCGYPDLPMSESSWQYYVTTAATMNSEYPIDENKLYPADFGAWATESYDLAVSDVYQPEVFLDQPLSQEYVDNMNTLLRGRMMYASHRLADLMVRIYGTNSTSVLQ